MWALALSQAVDRRASIFQDREKQYLSLVQKYSQDEVKAISHLLAKLVLLFEQHGPRDLLGEIYQELELHNKHRGQFFTPQSIANVISKVSLSDAGKIIEKKGFITVNDPAIGGGAMILGVLDQLQELGYSNQNMVAFGQDVDIKAIHMCYIQLSLLGIPAVLFCENTLTRPLLESDWLGTGDKPECVWFTGTYILQGWGRRLRAV